MYNMYVMRSSACLKRARKVFNIIDRVSSTYRWQYTRFALLQKFLNIWRFRRSISGRVNDIARHFAAVSQTAKT